MKIKLNNNIQMPMLGLGVYDMHNDEAISAVVHALNTGYRLIDTASMYGNEEQVGIAVRKSGNPQIILRWNLQLGVSTIPKSSNPKRIDENFNVFDFEISAEDMKVLNNMNENLRIVDDPMEMF